MGLMWNFDKRIGIVELTDKQTEQKYEWSLYQGNAFAIMINEKIGDNEDLYRVENFWADEEHAKRCLGLAKGFDNLLTDDVSYDYKFILNAEYEHCLKIAKLLRKAGISFEMFYNAGGATGTGGKQ